MVRTATLNARDVRLLDILTIDEVRLAGEDIKIATGRNGSLASE